MRRPRLLDLFSGAGGAAVGYHRAGFDVVGVDIAPQPRYPFPFICADALEWMREQTGFSEFDAIHASPPCQAYTGASNRWRGQGGKADGHDDLLFPTRALILAAGLPYVIENVPGARRRMFHPRVLTGEMFGLGVHRPRLFETNFALLVPPKPLPDPSAIGVYGRFHDGRRLWTRADGTEQRAAATLAEAREAMGIDWMEWRELAEAIPPAYTELIGHQLLAHIRAGVAA